MYALRLYRAGGWRTVLVDDWVPVRTAPHGDGGGGGGATTELVRPPPSPG
eukprot:COSAG01_NODE_9870_length_2315_cov_5.731047_2_plen_50_part_00